MKRAEQHLEVDALGERAFEGVVFDLDGVVTRTAALHATSWKRMFDEFLQQHAQSTGLPFEPFTIEEDYRLYVDGRPRIDGITTFLNSRSIKLPLGEVSDDPGFGSAWALGNLKNRGFTELVREQGVEVMEGTVALIKQLRARGIRVAVASSSKNCQFILQSAELESLFEARIDGVVSAELGLSGKPSPDIFLEAARRVGIEPQNSVVVEDATSGVQAGRAGGFGLVIGIGPEEVRLGLRTHGADWIVDAFDASSFEQIEAWFAERSHRLPSGLGNWDRLDQQLGETEVALFLDYDGTLTPIVSRPDLAVLTTSRREALQAVAEAMPTAIISGRGRPDVETLVGIPELAYAGSHGFDIIGPSGTPIDYEIADWIQPLMQKTAHDLELSLGSIDGCIIEPKRYSVAAHYRMVSDAQIADIETVVDRLIAGDSRLKKAAGKKVFEIRPALDWDKGKALLTLLRALELDSDANTPIYIGDDVTDEDAFRVLQACGGIGILVSETPRESAASYWLQDPFEVFAFLERLRQRASGGGQE